MNSDYVRDVRRFGSQRPYVDKDGKRSNLSHGQEFTSDDVVTDGRGNVCRMPLLSRKPCFGRPERAVRGLLEVGREYGEPSADGIRMRSKTKCDKCPIWAACLDLASERIASAKSVQEAFDAWWEGCDQSSAWGDKHAPYRAPNAARWSDFLSSIEKHGGWTSVNEENLSLYRQQKAAQKAKDRKEAKRKLRARQRAARSGKPVATSPAFIAALQDERDRRAEQLKRLRTAPLAPKWLLKMTETGCDRLADVWQGTVLLETAGHKPTGKAIAKWMIAQGKSYGLGLPSLGSRVLEDRKRIVRLEDDRGGNPVWKPWNAPCPRTPLTP